MNISATSLVSSVSSVSSVSATTGASRVSPTQDSETTASTDETSGASHTQLSKLGDLMSKLQDLQSSDPAKAKQVLTSIASALSDKASTSSDPHLKELADKFTEAAKTGDLSGLKPSGPPKGAHAHGGHHGHAHGPPAADQVAHYADGANNPMAELESVVSSALSSVSA